MGPQSKQVDPTQICLNLFLTDPSPGKALSQTVVLEAFTYIAFWPRQLQIAMDTFFSKSRFILLFGLFPFRNARRT